MTGADRRAARASGDRRQIAIVAGLVALGGALVLLAASRPWLRLTAARPAPFGPLSHSVAGRTEFGAVAGLAVVLLLGAVLLAVSGRLVRAALAVLLLAAAITTGWYGSRGFGRPGQGRATELLGGADKTQHAAVSVSVDGTWPAVAVAGSLLAVAGAGLLAARLRRWQPGLSARFDAPTSAPTSAPAGGAGNAPSAAPPGSAKQAPVAAARPDDPWQALDRGDDPTIADR